MKIALIHDYIKEYGGAERVLEALHEIWPEAPVFTTVYLPEFLGPHRERFDRWDIRTSGFQKFPFVHKLISPLRLFVAGYFENLDLREYDAVIVSATGAYQPNLIVRPPATIHICYCHTPPRFLYGYATARNWKKHIWGRIIGETMNHHLRQVDFISAQRPDFFIANSQEVKRRIEKFYRREAEVIYPPVGIVDKALDTKHMALGKDRGYFLAGGRLARAKHIDLIIGACNELKEPLKVFGRGFAAYGEELKLMAGPTVEFVGEVSDEELMELYAGAKALLFCSEDEDFGIMPVEAQACGTPVIAIRQGGVKETIIEGKTGVYFEELTVESIVKAMKLSSYRAPLRQGYAGQAIKSEDCRENARRFSKVRFQRQMLEFVEKIIHAGTS